MKLLCGFFMIAVVMGGIFIAFYVPHRPSLNICSTKFEWESIVHSMENLEVGLNWKMCCLLGGVCCGVRVLAGVKLYIYLFIIPHM